MSANSRMTVALHVLSYMVLAEKKGPDPVTSDRIASSVNTNPVVIRRILGLLHEANLVRSHRGANAGWTLVRKPNAITLLDVYKAVEEEPLFALHPSTPNQKCPIGRGIRPALGRFYGALEKRLEQQLSEMTLEQVFEETVN